MFCILKIDDVHMSIYYKCIIILYMCTCTCKIYKIN